MTAEWGIVIVLAIGMFLGIQELSAINAHLKSIRETLIGIKSDQESVRDALYGVAGDTNELRARLAPKPLPWDSEISG